MAYTNIPPSATLTPTKFEVHISDEKISRCKQLLSLSELGPETYENTTSDQYFGVTYKWMANAKKHWEEAYDWRNTEAKINSYPNYMVDVQDDDGEVYKIHFVALFSDKPDATPAVFLHGWPGSFLEFLGFLDVVKAKYPSPADLPFHIIVPSQPGYGFSSTASINKGIHMEDVSRIFDKLMCGLGFESGYIAQGGDTGSVLSRIMAARFSSCKAAHVNMCMMAPPPHVPEDAVTEAEKEGLKRWHDFERTGSAYAFLHRTRPATIGFVISSNPLALLAWVAEKFLTWSDTDPPLNDILDSASLYWFTNSFPTGIYHYRQLSEDPHLNTKWAIKEPKLFGYASFPKDLGPIPKAWAATTGNLVWYKLHESGGHFAAMEKPKELLEDVEDFVRLVGKDVPKL